MIRTFLRRALIGWWAIPVLGATYLPVIYLLTGWGEARAWFVETSKAIWDGV